MRVFHPAALRYQYVTYKEDLPANFYGQKEDEINKQMSWHEDGRNLVKFVYEQDQI
jgi:hypothetical protein